MLQSGVFIGKRPHRVAIYIDGSDYQQVPAFTVASLLLAAELEADIAPLLPTDHVDVTAPET